MDSSYQDQEDKSSPETFSDSSVPPDSPEASDIFGEPLVHPRVGDEYQVEIPPLLRESELLHLRMNPAHSEDFSDSSYSFLVGLPVPVMWVCDQATPIKNERMESIGYPNALTTDGPVESENISISRTSSLQKEPTVKVDAPDQTCVSNLYYIVPGLSTESWSDFEADCFLLGLYLFGKNLLQVRRFMDSKDMGQILAFYYGRFYGSAGYRKWSECRKMRSRKCVLGHKFFTGYRQQELFSRLLPRLSEESKTKLLEASRAFAEGRTSLDEYVSSIKTLVGIHALVEAVGIGKGKEDLTTLFLDSSKNSQNRPEIPSGKACSSLTCAEIVQYLTGDFRLSKARSNDLFWEAVWPRLLARGWHSEQPRGDGYAGSKNALVFLMPGIKKFSRRKLAKGEHYFDSVSDVLAKVASEPELLELEADEAKPSTSKEENGWAVEVTDDDQEPSDNERHCYLKPRVSGLSNLTKFTVVDTSLPHDDNPCKVRELRNLPLEAVRSSTLSRRSIKTGTELLDTADGLPNDYQQGSTSAHAKVPSNVRLPTDHKSRAIKHQFSRRVKPGPSASSGPVTKRRRLASCVDADLTYVLSLPAASKNGAFRGMSKNAFLPKTSQPHVKALSTDVPAPRSSNKILKISFNGNRVASRGVQDEKILRPHNVIDLNIPQVPIEPEIDNKVKLEVVENKANWQSGAEKPNNKVEGAENHNKTLSDAEKPMPKQKVEEGENNTNQHPHGEKQKPKHKVEEGQNNANQHSDAEKPKPKQKVEEGQNNTNQAEKPKPKQKVNEGVNNTNQNSDAEKTKYCDPAVASSDSKEAPVSSANKDVGFDQQPRRQSTRNRPLTTKALEALEIGFLNPVRHSRKRSPSTTQDQKSKRSRQPRPKSSMFPNVTSLEEPGADRTCNGKTDMLGSTPIVPVQIQKEAVSHELLGSSFSCRPEAP